jgi:hypothetical protein
VQRIQAANAFAVLGMQSLMTIGAMKNFMQGLTVMMNPLMTNNLQGCRVITGRLDLGYTLLIVTNKEKSNARY